MGGDHSHSHGPSLASAGERHKRPLFIAFCLILGFFFVEMIAGFATNSLALISDAAHMLTDVIGLGMALAAIQLASRQARARRRAGPDAAIDNKTFGLYRLEILAAFMNALLLFLVAVYVVIEAVRRFFDEPEVLGGPMLVVAVVGLIVNLIAFALLREGAKESVNVEGAYLEVLADTLGSVGVIIAALLLQVFGWTWADAVFAALIGLFILPRIWRLGRQAVRILIQAAPPELDLNRLQAELTAIDGVCEVHDLHVWTLTSGMESASAHLVVGGDTDHHRVLDQARDLFEDRYAIGHTTLQVEPDDHQGCADW